MKQNWAIWEKELTDDEIKKVIEECEQYPAEQAKVIGEDLDVDKIRRSEVRWVRGPLCESILWNYATSANASCFGFDIKREFPMQYTNYDSSIEGHYGWHQDTDFLEEGYDARKVSVVIQLSDPSEYEGGEFQFYIEEEIVSPPQFKTKGTVIVFPSFLKHRVTKVTKGSRNSLVSWIMGPHFK